MSTRASPSPAASSRSKPAAASSSNSSISSSHQQNTSAQPQTNTPPPTAPAVSTSKAPRRPSTSGPSSSKAPDVQENSRRSPSTASLKQKSSKNLDEMSVANKNEELIANYSKDFENIRTIISCKICTRCLYEPYIVACGHTYCYSCLMNWWGSSKKKTCPDCRTTVTQVPAPNYLVREMVGVFLSSPGTLAPGESTEQLKAEQKEEFEILQRDRDNQDPRRGGLFRGLFSSLGRRNFLQRAAVQDAQDGVDRCPECLWELEEGECGQCGFHLGAIWDQNIENYSDLDHSELGGSSEEMDGDVEIDDDFDDEDYPGDYDTFMETFGGLASVDMPNGEMLRRYLARDHAAMGHQGMFSRRRPAAHSAAGSRRRYSASIASDMFSEDHEMEALEEEDEADEDDEDSSMNDFLDDGTEHGSEASTSTDSQTPQPGARTTASQLPGNRNRRVVRSESRSTSYASTPGRDEDDEDEDEEGGPIPPGRQRRQQRMLARANGSFRTASSVSTEASADNELDEDTQRLLERQGWSPLQQYGAEEDMEEDDDDDDESDGGRTTVGWDPTAISSARPRNTNSLTPATDRPLQTRPRSRAGQSRMIDGSRGLRRRSSNMSVSTVNYEDGEADDDLSEVDRDGDTVMQSQQLRPRTSRVRLHTTNQSPTTRRPTNPSSLGDGIDGDTDDNSDDASIQSPRRTQLNRSRQAYDPRISLMFAQHQNTVQAYQNTVQASLNNRLNWLEEELRANTPIGRPRTANRNRPSRTTTPVTLDAHPANAGPFASVISPRSRRAIDQASAAETGDLLARNERLNSVRSDVTSIGGSVPTNGSRADRRGSVISISSSSAVSDSASHLSHSQRNADTSPTNLIPTSEDIIERPASRLPGRPPSANGRRGSQGQIPNYASLQMSPGPGLNYAQRTWQQQNRNPYFTGMLGPRQRPSSQRLREQSSTATLRASGSRRALRTQPSRDDVDDEVTVPAVRAQRSRVNLRSPPSAQRLQAQPSIRVLRQADGVQLHHPSLPLTGGGGTSRPVASSLLPEEERQRRANELVRTRQRELRNATNPFTANGRRPSISNSPNGSPAPGPTINYNNGQPVLAPPPSVGVSAANNPPASRPAVPGSPSGQATLNRRRSARNMGLPPGVLAPAQPSTSHIGPRNRLPNQIHHGPTANSNGVQRAVMANYAA